MIHDYLPMNRAEMNIRGWNQCDFVYVSGDAYVDHPSFGHAIITRLLEAHGYRVGIIAQPDWKDPFPKREDSRIPIPRAALWENARITRRLSTAI